MFAQRAESAMALFASTSPSYLILQSLDAMNPLLATSFPAQLKACAERLDTLKAKLRAHGYALCGEERTKLCLLPKSFGYTGTVLAEILTHHNIYCEFSDADHLVMMFTPETHPQISPVLSAHCSPFCPPRRSFQSRLCRRMPSVYFPRARRSSRRVKRYRFPSAKTAFWQTPT